MTVPVDIEAGDTKAEILEKANNMFAELFDPDWCTVTSTVATQSIPNATWTPVTFNTFVNNENTANIWLDNNKMVFQNIPGFGLDQATGFWNQIITIAWDNSAGGLVRHVRRVRGLGGDEAGFDIGGGIIAYELVGMSGEEIFDPAVGTTGELAYSFIQCHIQPGFDPLFVNPFLRTEVWHNAGQAINIVRVGIQAPVMQNVRLTDDERYYPTFPGFPDEPPNT